MVQNFVKNLFILNPTVRDLIPTHTSFLACRGHYLVFIWSFIMCAYHNKIFIDKYTK